MDEKYSVHVLSTIYRKSMLQSFVAPRVMWINFMYIQACTRHSQFYYFKLARDMGNVCEYNIIYIYIMKNEEFIKSRILSALFLFTLL